MTTTMHYTPTMVEEELQAMVESKRQYIARQEAGSPGARHMQREVLLLERTLRELQIRSDMYMSEMAKDIAAKVLQVRKHPMADRFVGILVYYETMPKHLWRSDGLNPVACVSNRRGWPQYGEGEMIEQAGSTFMTRNPSDCCHFLGGSFVPVTVEEEGRQ